MLGPHPLTGILKSWETLCEVQALQFRISWDLGVTSRLHDTVQGEGFVVKVCFSYQF